jgi:hypothetical protein
MESNGSPNMIQCSQKTADLLISSGKGHWLEKRADLVEAKGKGKLQTYWVEPPTRVRGEAESTHNSESTSRASEIDAMHIVGSVDAIAGARIERLIDWNVDAFAGLIKRVVARRMTVERSSKRSDAAAGPYNSSDSFHDLKNPRSEVAETIILPEFEFNMKAANSTEIPALELSEEVLWQLRDLISVIGYMYRPNAFHNFEHASHVTMSIMKLLQRVMTQDISLGRQCKTDLEAAEELASNLHNSTFGITSDPLTQFAIVFAALVHDRTSLLPCSDSRSSRSLFPRL